MSSDQLSRILHVTFLTQVGDFNLSRMADTAAVTSIMSANNPRWLAPEVITHQVTSVFLQRRSSNETASWNWLIQLPSAATPSICIDSVPADLL